MSLATRGGATRFGGKIDCFRLMWNEMRRSYVERLNAGAEELGDNDDSTILLEAWEDGTDDTPDPRAGSGILGFEAWRMGGSPRTLDNRSGWFTVTYHVTICPETARGPSVRLQPGGPRSALTGTGADNLTEAVRKRTVAKRKLRMSVTRYAQMRLMVDATFETRAVNEESAENTRLYVRSV